jgi:hypothetical protein
MAEENQTNLEGGQNSVNPLGAGVGAGAGAGAVQNPPGVGSGAGVVQNLSSGSVGGVGAGSGGALGSANASPASVDTVNASPASVDAVNASPASLDTVNASPASLDTVNASPASVDTSNASPASLGSVQVDSLNGQAGGANVSVNMQNSNDSGVQSFEMGESSNQVNYPVADPLKAGLGNEMPSPVAPMPTNSPSEVSISSLPERESQASNLPIEEMKQVEEAQKEADLAQINKVVEDLNDNSGSEAGNVLKNKKPLIIGGIALLLVLLSVLAYVFLVGDSEEDIVEERNTLGSEPAPPSMQSPFELVEGDNETDELGTEDFENPLEEDVLPVDENLQDLVDVIDDLEEVAPPVLDLINDEEVKEEEPTEPVKRVVR